MEEQRLEVRITAIDAKGQELHVHYRIRSRSTAPVFLVHHRRLPFLRFKPEEATLEIWQGIPPQTDLEASRDIHSLILPNTQELDPGATREGTAVLVRPLKQSGYWTESGEETEIPLGRNDEIKIVVIQGFGIHALNARNVRSIEELFQWQKTAKSQAVTARIPVGR